MPDLLDRVFQNIRAKFLAIWGTLEVFGIVGSFGISGKFEFLEILEIRKVWGENIENFGIDFGRADWHPPDDRPCMTTHKKGHGLSTGGERPCTYIYIYICGGVLSV